MSSQEMYSRFLDGRAAQRLAREIGTQRPNEEQMKILLRGLRGCEHDVTVLADSSLPLSIASSILRVVDFDESDPVFHSLLAHMEFRAGEYSQAVQSACKACELEPSNPRRYRQLADMYARLYEAPKSPADLHSGVHLVVTLQKLIQLKPDDPEIRRMQHETMRYMELIGPCELAARDWVSRRPNDASAHFALAHGHVTAGRQTEALESLRTGRRLEPRGAFWRFQLECYPDSGTAQDLTEIDKALQGSPSPVDTVELLFAKGHILDHQGNYAQAFECFREGNRQLEALAFDEPYSSARASTIDLLRRAYPPASGGPRGILRTVPSFPQPIFVVGLPRTGSTLVQQILASHKSEDGSHIVFAGNELVQLGKLREVFEFRSRHRFENEVEQRRLIPALAIEYLASCRSILGLEQRPEVKHFVDKLPDNIHQIELILQLFPDAPIVVCERNYLDVGISAFKRNFGNQVDMREFNDLERYGRYIKDYYQPFIDIWKAALDRNRVHFLRYEDLVQDPNTHIPKLLRYCNLPWSESCLRPQDHAVPNFTETRARKAIDTSAIGAWRKYEKELAPLVAILGNGEPNGYPSVP